MTYTRKEILEVIDRHLDNHGPAIQGNREKRQALESLRHDIERGRTVAKRGAQAVSEKKR